MQYSRLTLTKWSVVCMCYNMAGLLFIKLSLAVILAAGVYGNISYSSSSKDKSISYDYQADATTDSSVKTSSLDGGHDSGMPASNDSLPGEKEYDGKKMISSTYDSGSGMRASNDSLSAEKEYDVNKMSSSTYDDKMEKEGEDVRHDPVRSDVKNPLKKEQEVVFDDSQLKKAAELIVGRYWYVNIFKELIKMFS